MKIKYIAEGSYGCVLKPAKKCDINLNINNTVVKIFKDKNDYIDELYNYKIVENIFKNNKNIIVIKLSNCKKNINDYDINTILKCKNSFNKIINNQDIYQIIYQYGGIDSWELSTNPKYKITFKDLFKSLDNVFKGLYILQKKNYMHQDIRSPNILINIKKKSSKIIDFGFLIKMKNFYNINNQYINKPHLSYPHEINIGNFLIFYNYYLNLILKMENKYKKNKIKIKKIKELKIFLTNLYNKTIKLYDENKIEINLHKFDICMLGLSLFDLLINYIYNNKKLNLNNYQYSLILLFIKNLINIDTSKRYSIKKAKNEFYKIKKIL